MASSRQRPTSPVEEDLQQLYNEVWAVFAEESQPASTEGDLDQIYTGYSDAPDSKSKSTQEISPATYTYEVPRPYSNFAPPDPYPQSPASPKSPNTRRRLPPTPDESVYQTNVPFMMPEPDPYIPQRTSNPNPQLYNSTSYASFSSNSPVSLVRRTTASSAKSSNSGRRLPQAPMTPDTMRSSQDGEERTPVSTNSYSSYGNASSYSSSTSPGNYTANPGYPRNGTYRPPGASPPTIPTSYFNSYSDSQASFEIPEFSAYENGKMGGGSSQFYQPPSSPRSTEITQTTNTSFVPPPPPPPVSIYPPERKPSPELPPLPPKDKAYSRYLESTYASPSTLSPYADDGKNASQTEVFEDNRRPVSDSNSPHPSTNQHLPSPYVQEEKWDGDAYADQDDSPYDGTLSVSEDPVHIGRQPSQVLNALANYHPDQHLQMNDEEPGGYWEDEDEDDENRFVNFSLLSNIAMQMRDKIPRGTHVKESVPFARSFTGKDVVSTIQSLIQRELAINHGVSTSDRRVSLQIARSLQSQLFFMEVEWVPQILQDGVEDVYSFMADQAAGSDVFQGMEELPTGLITMLTRCYSPSCGEGTCYAYGCPRKGNFPIAPSTVRQEEPAAPKQEKWMATLAPDLLDTLPKTELERQRIIHVLISNEEQYLQDLDLVESCFIQPLRAANPPIMDPNLLDDFIDDVFGNILDLRECNRRLLEVLYVRQREEKPIIVRIGDIFLDAATEFRLAYPAYIGHHPIAERRMKDEIDNNPNFKVFLEQCARQQGNKFTERPPLELKAFLGRPAEHLQKYPIRLEAVLHETDQANPDIAYLVEAIDAIKNLQSVAQLRTFQSAMGKGTPGKWEWHDLVSPEVREQFSKKEGKRQSIIFELIKGEMAYVKDLENFLHMYILPLRSADPPIIPLDRLEQFCQDVYHNYAEVLVHHQKLVERFHEIQREQHPRIHSITAPLFDAALNWRDAYLDYIPNYPIAAYRIDDEMANNSAFKAFVDQCVRHPDAHRLDMKSFINRPIPRLLRYELLLKGILDETPDDHEDQGAIPNVIDVIKVLGKETEPGVTSAKTKVEVWRYHSNLVFKPGEWIDMDLLDGRRSLVHVGKLLRQPESGLEWNGWSELHVVLFDNYFVMTKPKERDGVTKYLVNRRPIPLDLLTLVNFTDPPTQRSAGLLRKLGGQSHVEGGVNSPGVSPESANDARSVWPFTLHYNGRMGGTYILYAESAAIRSEWKEKLEEALGLRKVVQDSEKAFEIEYLSRDTFVMPLVTTVGTTPGWNQDSQYTGKVTCSVPFNTADGRALVAIGCTEGVWIGFRHDPKSIRRVLHLKMVTQCAMLEDFGIFLVLADKALFAYHIEALVPSSPHGAHTSQVPQKLSGAKDVHFFSVGTNQGRTLIIYMKKKNLDSIFRVLEPVDDKIGGRAKAPVGFGSRLGFKSPKSEWFRIYRDFFLPSDSFDVVFLKARIAIFCAKGFEIMNLQDFESMTIPLRDDPKYAQIAKRCESCKPLGMFRTTDDEFLLCYDEFGLYVDKHGEPCRAIATIEWEGTPERAAFHSPYVLLFNTNFIEIRHVQTGRLVQIISGTDIRCTWDGRGVNTNHSAIPAPNNPHDQEAQVHVVMNSMDTVPGPGGMRSRNIVQHVCELIPTRQLYPVTPGSVTVPSSMNPQMPFTSPTAQEVASPFTGSRYMTPSGFTNSSPPRSPEMRSSHSWRS